MIAIIAAAALAVSAMQFDLKCEDANVTQVGGEPVTRSPGPSEFSIDLAHHTWAPVAKGEVQLPRELFSVTPTEIVLSRDKTMDMTINRVTGILGTYLDLAGMGRQITFDKCIKAQYRPMAEQKF